MKYFEENENGLYTSEEKCKNIKELFYKNTLIDNLDEESKDWHNFILQILKSGNNKVYLKGGSVIGIYLLNYLYKNFNENTFKTQLVDLFKLNLIKDWDFTVYANERTDDNDFNFEGFNNEGATIKIYRWRKKDPTLIKIEGSPDEFLFEVSVKKGEPVSELEIPMTAMKVAINERNIYYVLLLAKFIFLYKINKIKYDILEDFLLDKTIKKFIQNFEIIIPEARNGFFKINSESDIDNGGLSNELLNVIKRSSEKINNNAFDSRQFLISEMKEPDRFFVRLVDKNLPKSEKIKNFINTNESWLLDKELINSLSESFLIEIEKEIKMFYQINELDKLFSILEDLQNISSCLNYYKIKEMLIQEVENIENINNNDFLNNIEIKFGIHSDKFKKINSMYNRVFSNKEKYEISKDLLEYNTKNIRIFVNKEIDEVNNKIYKLIVNKIDMLTTYSEIKIFRKKLSDIKSRIEKIFNDKLLYVCKNIFKNVNLGKLSSDYVIKYKPSIKDKIDKIFSPFNDYIKVYNVPETCNLLNSIKNRKN